MQTGNFVLDYPHLQAVAEAGSAAYASASPFPHAVIDDLFSPALVTTLLRHFPDDVAGVRAESDDVAMATGKLAQYRKGFMSREGLVDIALRRIYWELNSGPFIGFLERLTGCENLIGDPYLQGGGVHEVGDGGFLRVHADFSQHASLKLSRRLNVLVYLNQNWSPEYGGELELWNEPMSERVQSIEPLAGRCVIFSTTSTSWHGHPHPLRCPPGVSRKSIALYYYSNDVRNRPQHETLWQQLPGE